MYTGANTLEMNWDKGKCEWVRHTEMIRDYNTYPNRNRDRAPTPEIFRAASDRCNSMLAPALDYLMVTPFSILAGMLPAAFVGSELPVPRALTVTAGCVLLATNVAGAAYVARKPDESISRTARNCHLVVFGIVGAAALFLVCV